MENSCEFLQHLQKTDEKLFNRVVKGFIERSYDFGTLNEFFIKFNLNRFEAIFSVIKYGYGEEFYIFKFTDYLASIKNLSKISSTDNYDKCWKFYLKSHLTGEALKKYNQKLLDFVNEETLKYRNNLLYDNGFSNEEINQINAKNKTVLKK